MERDKIIDLLNQRPGYEVVYLLIKSERCRRIKLGEYVGTSGGTLERWLKRAKMEGLVRKHTFIQADEKVVEYSLACSIPSDLIPIIKNRGGSGPRDEHGKFADVQGQNYWVDEHDL